MREHEWKWSRRNRRCANIWSKFSVQLPWTTISPPVKGDYYVWSETCWIRHGAVACRIVNWKGLNAYSVTSPLNICTKLVYGFLGHLVVHPQKEKNCVVSIIYLIEWTAKGGGRGSNCNMKFWVEKWGNMNDSGPARIEVVQIFGQFSVQLPWTTISPPVTGDYHVWSDTGSIRHGAVVCRIVNWKGLNAYSVTKSLNIWTTFGVWLPRTLSGPP